MGNRLGAMVFVVAAFALGYWVMTGRAGNFMAALKGQPTSQSPPNPLFRMLVPPLTPPWTQWINNNIPQGTGSGAPPNPYENPSVNQWAIA